MNKFIPGEYVHCELSDRQIDTMIARGGFEPNERDDISEMSIGGYVPDERGGNSTFNFSINGEDTGFEIEWLDIPRSIKEKLIPIHHHGGTRTGAGRKPTPPDQRMRRRSIGMLESDWRIAKQIATAENVSVDEVMRRVIRATNNTAAQIQRKSKEKTK